MLFNEIILFRFPVVFVRNKFSNYTYEVLHNLHHMTSPYSTPAVVFTVTSVEMSNYHAVHGHGVEPIAVDKQTYRGVGWSLQQLMDG